MSTVGGDPKGLSEEERAKKEAAAKAAAAAASAAAPLSFVGAVARPTPAPDRKGVAEDKSEAEIKPGSGNIKLTQRITQLVLSTVAKELGEEIKTVTDPKTGITSYHPGPNQKFEDFVDTTLTAMQEKFKGVAAQTTQFNPKDCNLELEFPKDWDYSKAQSMLAGMKPEQREMLGNIIIYDQNKQPVTFHLEGNQLKLGEKPPEIKTSADIPLAFTGVQKDAAALQLSAAAMPASPHAGVGGAKPPFTPADELAVSATPSLKESAPKPIPAPAPAAVPGAGPATASEPAPAATSPAAAPKPP